MKSSNMIIVTSTNDGPLTESDFIFGVLDSKGSITTDELKEMGVTSPRSAIRGLREEGFVITSKLVERSDSANSCRGMQVEYTLPCANLHDDSAYFEECNQEIDK